MTAEHEIDLKAGRRRVPRTRGALSGILLVVLGAWAALVPFIGPYFNFGITPKPNDAWHWTSGRGWLEVLPGAVALVGGLLLLLSSSRLMTLVGAWLGIVGGAWLVIGTSLSEVLKLSAGGPDPSLGKGGRAAESLLYFFGIGAAIVLVAGIALGRLSVHSVRDVRAAERRAEHEAAEQQRIEEERRAAYERERVENERRDAERGRRDDGVVDGNDRRDGDLRDGELQDGDGRRGGAGVGGIPTVSGHHTGRSDEGVGDPAAQQTRAAAGSDSYRGGQAPTQNIPQGPPPQQPQYQQPPQQGAPQGYPQAPPPPPPA